MFLLFSYCCCCSYIQAIHLISLTSNVNLQKPWTFLFKFHHHVFLDSARLALPLGVLKQDWSFHKLKVTAQLSVIYTSEFVRHKIWQIKKIWQPFHLCIFVHLGFHWDWARTWTNFSLQDEPWAEFSTLEVAACVILCTYHPVLQNNLT